MNGTSVSRGLTFTSLEKAVRLNDTSGEIVHNESADILEGMECNICERLTTRKCSRCGLGWVLLISM